MTYARVWGMSEFNDFLKLVAEGKKNTPSARVKKITDEVKENVKGDLASLFEQLAAVKTPQERLAAGEPVRISELPEIQAEISAAIESGEVSVQGELNEVVLPTPVGKVPETAQVPDLDKYLKPKSDTPKEEPLTNEFRQVNDKIKFLERWVSQIQNTGPGSGEVNFRYLDDVNRLTMGDSNDNWVLEYDIATKKVQFTENIGPIRSIKLNTAGPQQALVAGQFAWNPEEDCLDVKHADGTTLQSGLEQHIRVHNHTSSVMTNGTVVMFAGVENTNEIAMPIIGKYIANSSASPLYIIGVLTSDIAPGGIGRATTFGYVRELNTTGSSVGETWGQGDLLWAHPTIAGAMTKVRPSAPNVSTSIAAVTRVGTTDGQILVRPTIWPRLYYGDWYDDANQIAALPNTAYPVKVMHSGAVSGFEVVNNQDIKALNAGRYNFEFSLQVTSSNSSTSRIYIWYRKNGVDIPHSATVMTIASNGGKLAPSWNFPVLMEANDTFTLMWATDSTNVSLSAEPATAFCPSIPSVILTVAQTNL